MIRLEDLSKVGFGTYRISINSTENVTALSEAIVSGCNLIDTASNYTNGDSEKLIGKVLENLNKEVFIISKAGYISGNNLKTFKNLNNRKKGLLDIVHISEDFKHSIHPEYLDAQINISLKRLNRKYLDCFLLHSPEYYYQEPNEGSGSNSNEYYSRMKKAFEFLEEQVTKGKIRYYGVSSNTLSLDSNNPKATDIKRLLSITNEVSLNNHFKFIQFPFNIVENEASLRSLESSKSLLEFAKEKNIVTLGNRPLNANTSKGLLKLVIHNNDLLNLNDIKSSSIYKQFSDIIEEQLRKVSDSNLSEISVLVFLKENWMNIESTSAFNKIFYEMLYPFLNFIFENNIPKKASQLFKQFEAISWNYHLKLLSIKTTNYLNLNNLSDLLDSTKPLSSMLANKYLEMGIDHVLMGMTKPIYVDEVKHLFKN